MMKKKFVKGRKLRRKDWRFDGIQQRKFAEKVEMPDRTGISTGNCSGSLANAVELAEFPACFSLLATFLDTWFFVVFTTLQLSFYPIDL
jgi:hypothetical protein